MLAGRARYPPRRAARRARHGLTRAGRRSERTKAAGWRRGRRRPGGTAAPHWRTERRRWRRHVGGGENGGGAASGGPRAAVRLAAVEWAARRAAAARAAATTATARRAATGAARAAHSRAEPSIPAPLGRPRRLCCPRTAGSSCRAPPDSPRGPPACRSPRLRLSEEWKEGHHAVGLVDRARLAKLAQPVRGHEAPLSQRGRPRVHPGRGQALPFEPSGHAATRGHAQSAAREGVKEGCKDRCEGTAGNGGTLMRNEWVCARKYARERTGVYLYLLVDCALRRLCCSSEVCARAGCTRPQRGRICTTCALPRRCHVQPWVGRD